MTDTTISDAIVFAQDDGTGVSDGSEDYSSAAFFSALAKYQGYGSYVGEDNTGSATLQFNDVDTTNEQVDVGTGYAYITESGHTVQSGSQTTYDTTIPIDTPYVVMLPSEVVDLGLGTDNVNDLWLAVDPTTNDDVYIRHGNGLSAPTDPNVKLGTVDTASGATTRANDLSTTSNKSVSTDQTTIGGGDVINQVEFGAASYSSSVNAASDDGTDTRETIDVSVSFSQTFSSAPYVIPGNIDGRGETIALNVTTTEFTLRFTNYTSSSFLPGGGSGFPWIAIQ